MQTDILFSSEAQVAHDLRNMLASLQLNLNLLQERNPSGEQAEILSEALDALGAAQEIIATLEQQAEARQREPLSFPDLLHGAWHLLPRPLQMRVRLSSVLPEDPTLQGHRVVLLRVLYNLLLNAAEACQAHGGRIETRMERSGDQVLLRIIDDGPGIPSAILERLAGSGPPIGAGERRSQGLLICRQLLASQDGTLHIEGAPGAGTTATITLVGA